MRPKVVLGIFIAACALAAVMVISRTSRPKPATTVVAPAPAANPMPADVPPPAPSPMVASAPEPEAASVSAEGTNSGTNSPAHEEYVQKRSDELMGIAMLNDAVAHQEIVRELTNSDPAIRQAALDAVQQTSDRSLIPQMQQIADATQDPAYKQALQSAIDFMKLPTLSEYLQQQKSQPSASAVPPPGPPPVPPPQPSQQAQGQN